jgi:hypothetical protein
MFIFESLDVSSCRWKRMEWFLRVIYPPNIELMGGDVEFLDDIHHSDTPLDEELRRSMFR